MDVTEGKIEEKRRKKDDVNSYWITSREREDILEFERGILKNSLWKRLWTCRKKDQADEINTCYIFEFNFVNFIFELV